MSGELVNLSSVRPVEPRFILSFVRSVADGVKLTACEISNHEFTNRTTFEQAKDPHEVLDPALAQAISDKLEQISDDHEVWSFPEFFVELPDLFLGYARVITSEVTNGLQTLIFRFQKFFGSINRAFCVDVGLDGSLTHRAEDLVAELVSDVALPLQNLSEAIRMRMARADDNAAEMVTLLAKRSDTLFEKLTMIRRFVGGIDNGFPGFGINHANSGAKHHRLRQVATDPFDSDTT